MSSVIGMLCHWKIESTGRQSGSGKETSIQEATTWNKYTHDIVVEDKAKLKIIAVNNNSGVIWLDNFNTNFLIW